MERAVSNVCSNVLWQTDMNGYWIRGIKAVRPGRHKGINTLGAFVSTVCNGHCVSAVSIVHLVCSVQMAMCVCVFRSVPMYVCRAGAVHILPCVTCPCLGITGSTVIAQPGPGFLCTGTVHILPWVTCPCRGE